MRGIFRGMKRTLFRNAHVVLPDAVRSGSVLIEGSRILDVDAGENARHDQLIDCSGLHLMPGVVDDQGIGDPRFRGDRVGCARPGRILTSRPDTVGTVQT